ncbi:MAG: rhodanese-like domain-containing protein [Planctomycetota bacterium]|jgi:rhodanese-related sulfurtransferase
MNSYCVLQPADLKQRLADATSPRLVDVRDLDEFTSVHVRGARCVPLPTLLKRVSDWSQDEELMLICHSGQRAREAATQLREVGFERLSVVDGGTEACAKADVSIVRGKKRIPIQRQVFIGAGLVVLGGLTLSLVHPAYVLISWFAAGSMIFAGASGFCPMAKVLALASWNRPGNASDSLPASSCAIQGGCS